MRRVRAFTLIEVLVVVAIIALLLGIMMPSLREVRRVSKRTVCQKNLDQIGVGMHAYLLTNKDTFPYACRLPSWEDSVARSEDRPAYVPLPVALKHELGSAGEVFQCPADQNTMSKDPDPDAPSAIMTDRYFDSEKTSYEWESRLNGVTISFRWVKIYSHYANKKYEIAKKDQKQMWMVYDFEPFHGGPKMRGSHNILYTDLHVESDKWEEGSGGKKVGKEL
jgi:prepilin-type N-terminal cleavage/methylation domain-containing protein